MKTISERLRSIRNLNFGEMVLEHCSTTDRNRVQQGGRRWQPFRERKMATKIFNKCDKKYRDKIAYVRA